MRTMVLARKRPAVVPSTLWELYFVARGRAGTLHVWAPDGATAIATVRAHPSMFGINDPYPLVGHATGIRLEGDLDGVLDRLGPAAG